MTFDQRSQELFNWLTENQSVAISNYQLISGDASFRRYFRFNIANNHYIAVDAPIETEDNPLFVALSQCLLEQNIVTAKVLDHDFDKGFMLQQDLGNTHLGDIINCDNVASWYQQALNLLPALENITQTHLGPIPQYDEKQVRFELSIFIEWLLEKHLFIKLTDDETRLFNQAFDLLCDNFLAQDKTFVHRDFHSRNLMITANNDIAVIDFQGGLVGPITYDVVSLLRDCYVKWPASTVNQLSEQHRAKYHPHVAANIWQRWFDLTGIQRHLKAAGIFARLHHRDSKSHYLADIPRTLQYIVDVAETHAELAEFAHFINQKVLKTLIKNSQGK